MKDVMIQITAAQSDAERSRDELAEFSTEGQFECRDGSGVIIYLESELTGMEGTETTIRFRPDGAVLSRVGTLTGQMDFTPGERNTFLYETPYGSSTVGLQTQRYNAALNEQGGTLEIEYVVDFDHAFVGTNTLHITIQEQRGNEHGKQD